MRLRVRGRSALLYSSLLETSGLDPRSRRSAIALAGRIGRPERRPSDQSTAIRRTVGGATREMSIRVPDHTVRGFLFGRASWNGLARASRKGAI